MEFKYHIVFAPKYRRKVFYVDTAGKNAKKMQEYIQHQLDEGKTGEQLAMGNF